MRTKEIDTKKISSITLPNSLRDGRAFVIEGKDTLIVKKSSITAFSYTRERLRLLKDKISQKDIDKAVRAARE